MVEQMQRFGAVDAVLFLIGKKHKGRIGEQIGGGSHRPAQLFDRLDKGVHHSQLGGQNGNQPVIVAENLFADHKAGCRRLHRCPFLPRR